MGGSRGDLARAFESVESGDRLTNRFNPSDYSDGVGSVFTAPPSNTASGPSDFSFTGGTGSLRRRRDFTGHEGSSPDFEFDHKDKRDFEFGTTSAGRGLGSESHIDAQIRRAQANIPRRGGRNRSRPNWGQSSPESWSSGLGEINPMERASLSRLPGLEGLGYVQPESSQGGFQFTSSMGNTDQYRWLSENHPEIFNQMAIDAASAHSPSPRSSRDYYMRSIGGDDQLNLEADRFRDEWLNPVGSNSSDSGFQFRNLNPADPSSSGLGSFEFNRITDKERLGGMSPRDGLGDYGDSRWWLRGRIR